MKPSRLFVCAAAVSVVAFGAWTLGASPNLPPDCQPCGPSSNRPGSICPLFFDPVEGFKGNGASVGEFGNSCEACTTPGVVCYVDLPFPGRTGG